MALPSKGKPTAQQVVDWAKWMADNHKGVDRWKVGSSVGTYLTTFSIDIGILELGAMQMHGST